MRLEFPGARHRVTARGDIDAASSGDDVDRRYFLELPAEQPERFGVRVVAWALMDDYYHLLLETPENPPLAMRPLESTFRLV